MTKNQSLLFRILLFLAGAGIIVLAFFLINGNRELGEKDIFIWVSIGLMYVILFSPFLLTAISIANFSGKIPRLSLIWPGIFLYVGTSIAVIVLLVVTQVITVKIAIIIQAILLFLFLINIYLAFFASSHVRKVASEEAGKQQFIKQLKPKAQVLLLSVDKLPAEYGNAQKIMKQAIEETKYIYPVDNGIGYDLESKILQSLNNLSELLSVIQTGVYMVSLETEAEKLLMLVKERKLLRN